MKRSAAIIGSTPGFLRWAIWQPCQLRELDDVEKLDSQLPDTTFRQLRGVREISVARLENRIFEDICVHPQATSREPGSALGFPVAEVAGFYGGPETIEEACRGCPANAIVAHQPGLQAGCFGWLPVDTNFDLERLTRGESEAGKTELNSDTPNSDLIELVERSVAQLHLEPLIQQRFLRTRPAWYGLWSNLILTQDQLSAIEQLFVHVLASKDVESMSNSKDSKWRTELVRFVDALSSCRKNWLALHVEFVPAGFSDGAIWKIPRHCGYCRFELASESPGRCPSCHQHGKTQSERRFKVLGLRPYMHLHSILGPSQTKEFLLRYESQFT